MISFIVPAWNEESSLPATIDALAAAGRGLGRPFEIVVANDASTDRTAEVARAHGALVVEVQCRQIAGTRNRGARAASGEILIFVDADTAVPSETARAAVAAIEQGAAGGGARVEFDGRVSPAAWCFGKAFTFIYHGLGLAAGCFIFARRDAFEAAGGFDERFYASEEVHLSRALRKQGRFVIIPERVYTSARKIRLYRFGGLLRQLLSIVFRGPGSLKKREGLGMWYDGKRE